MLTAPITAVVCQVIPVTEKESVSMVSCKNTSVVKMTYHVCILRDWGDQKTKRGPLFHCLFYTYFNFITTTLFLLLLLF